MVRPAADPQSRRNLPAIQATLNASLRATTTTDSLQSGPNTIEMRICKMHQGIAEAWPVPFNDQRNPLAFFGQQVVETPLHGALACAFLQGFGVQWQVQTECDVPRLA